MSNIGGKVSTGPYSVAGMPVTVPADFLGIYFNHYPGSGPSPTGLRYKNTCQIDYLTTHGLSASPTCWTRIEQTQGVYTYTSMDAWADAHYPKSLIYCLQAMPAFYSANPTAISDWGGVLGYGGPLNALGRSSGLANFVTTTIARYINRGTPLKYLQLWTEPDFNSAQSGLPTTGIGTWWGTEGDLVDLCYIAYTAAKAADPTITVLGPSYFYNHTQNFMQATGTVNTGIAGYQTIDVMTYDCFNAGPPAMGAGLLEGGAFVPDVVVENAWFLSKLVTHSKPLAVTSFGFDGIPYAVGSSQYLAMQQSAQWRKQWLGRVLLMYAAYGYKLALCYAYDTAYNISPPQYYCGDFINDTNGVIAAFNEISDNVCGRTITSCSYYHNGPVTATFSTGSPYTI